MLVGMNCKIRPTCKGDRIHEEGIIASEPALLEENEYRVLVLIRGKLQITDTYFIYDVGVEYE